jgi:hypothetical protein
MANVAVIDSNPAWRAHLDATAHIRLATHDDLRWADGYAFGTPTRYGNVSSQLNAIKRHGGNESTLLALYNTMHHWGAVVIAPGYTDDAFSRARRSAVSVRGRASGATGSGILALLAVAESCSRSTSRSSTSRCPASTTALDSSLGSPQWVVNGYALTFAGALLLGGRTADVVRGRRVFLVALSAFALASRWFRSGCSARDRCGRATCSASSASSR